MYRELKCPVWFQDLDAALKKALSGEVEALLLELLMPPLGYEAYRLQKAMEVSVCVCVFLDFSIISQDILYKRLCVCVCVCRVWAQMRRHCWRSCAHDLESSFKKSAWRTKRVNPRPRLSSHCSSISISRSMISLILTSCLVFLSVQEGPGEGAEGRNQWRLC